MGRLFCVGLAALIVASGAVATAADLPQGSYRYRSSIRHGRFPAGYGYETADRAVAGCPHLPSLDYRPRLVGQPGCYAARPYGMSSRLYGTIVQPQWGAEY